MSTRTADYEFSLPDELIARHPAPRRDASRMLVLRRKERTIEHRTFTEFASLIPPDSLVVLNNTKVIPARVFSDDGRIELLLLEALSPTRWQSMVRPGKKMRLGAEVVVDGVIGRVQQVLESGERIIEFEQVLDLDRVGKLPLPPYFEREADQEDQERYQTVYAREPGAVAAPTAGLHFTPEILARVPHEFVTLHVGAGTFKPVQVEDVSLHSMHEERFLVSETAAARLNTAPCVVAAGTTTVRVLETCMRDHGQIVAGRGSTNIFIHPPHPFRRVNALLTNFHLPKSTLLMLVSAFADREFILHAYEEAVRERYRFFSYGDCMLIL
ncbi:MAG: tRNA preQ1(34) S-adenosylmethionine ribosyltransferase-isomerase QueA [Chthoniobacteraceae bacterium]